MNRQEIAARTDALIENVLFLLEVGEDPARIPPRVGKTSCAIRQTLTRRGMRQYANLFDNRTGAHQ